MAVACPSAADAAAVLPSMPPEAPSPPPSPSLSPTHIFKRGDDLRQDLVTLMLLGQMNVLWRERGSRAFTCTYRIWLTGESAGFIEALPNAKPVKRCADFTYSEALHSSAVGAFTAGFVLGLADRHQDNMLLAGPRQVKLRATLRAMRTVTVTVTVRLRPRNG